MKKEDRNAESNPFEFSVIMPIYNVDKYLREAVDSIIAQDFGFNKIQLVLVDDGSPDTSGAICDEYAAKYPSNIIVIHKENGGQSSARNAGVKVATGRYLNFCDPDDKMDSNVFSAVHKFFQEHEDETDIVSIPMMFFGDYSGEHVLNNKFKQGNRVIDLNREWSLTQLSLSSAFVKKNVAKKLCFNENLVMAHAEDARELIKILCYNAHLGVVSNCYYRYRRRADSFITSSRKNPLSYTAYLQDYSQFAFDYATECFGFIPKYIQMPVMYDLQWLIKEAELPTDVLDDTQCGAFLSLIKNLFNYIDDDVILVQRHLNHAQKIWVLEQKYNIPFRPIHCGNVVYLAQKDEAPFCMADAETRLQFYVIEKKNCTIEGYTLIYPAHLRDIKVMLAINDELYPCEYVERETVNYALSEPISYRYGFKCTFSLENRVEKTNIRVIVALNGLPDEMRNLSVGQFFPVLPQYSNSYFIQKGYSLTMNKKQLTLKCYDKSGSFKSELLFLKELWKKNKLGTRKAVQARIAYHVLKLFKHKPIWLVSDRMNKADDNGEAFFRYLQQEHRHDVHSFFVIGKDCDDYVRMKAIGPTVARRSYWHKILFMLCDYNISAQADAGDTNPFYGHDSGYRDIISQKRFIFLQHGITKDDISSWLNRYSKNIYGFITAARPEAQSILANNNYHYGEKHVWMTGFPRFDRRYNADAKQITIMPTWRKYLINHDLEGSEIVAKDMEQSDFFLFYKRLLNDERLIDAAQRTGYALCLFPHPNMQSHMDAFNASPAINLMNINTSYNEVYARSSLVVTDYSSAVFDFAYLRKPVVYCQFDSEEFFSGKHTFTKGYFDYERDGFGEVEHDLDGTVDRIIEYMENGCVLKDKYRERIDSFFAFNDNNNCQRVYERIIEQERNDK